MNKRRFHSLFLLLLAFVLLVLLAIYLITEPRTSDSLKALYDQPEEGQGMVMPDSDVDKMTSAEIEVMDDSLLPEETKAWIDELQPHQYHPDPFIEAKTVTGLYVMCTDEVNNILSIEKQLAERTQVSLVNDYIKYCTEAKRRYPKLLSLFDTQNQLREIPSTSDLGQLIKQGYTNDDPNYPQIYRMSATKKIHAVIKSQNAALLVEQSWVAFQQFQYGEILPVSTWLNSQDMGYNNKVSWYALIKMSCRYQQGVSCEPFGASTLIMCADDTSDCGLDFETIYQREVMPGMQKDVGILISHFDQLGR